MEITSEMALRELRRRGKLGGVKDRSEASRRRARAEGTMELTSAELRSIAETRSALAAAEKSATPSPSGPSNSGSQDRGDSDPELSEVDSLISEFRDAHQMVSKAEIRELRRKLPQWLAAYSHDSVRTAVRKGSTVAHVGHLVEQISSRRSQLQTPANERKQQRPLRSGSRRGAINRSVTAESRRAAGRSGTRGQTSATPSSVGSSLDSLEDVLDPSESGDERPQRMPGPAKSAYDTTDLSLTEALEYVTGLPWTDQFHSSYIGLSAPFDFTSLHDECATTLRKIAKNPERKRIARAGILLSLAEKVEEFNSLALQDAAGQILSYASPPGDDEYALHAFIGLNGQHAGNSTRAAAVADLSRPRFLRLKNAVRRESLGRVWLPQLETATRALETEAARADRDPDPSELRIVSAVADLLGTDGQRLRLARLGNPTEHAAAEVSGVVDIESAVHRLAEPYGFIRISDAIDELVGAGVTTSLPDLQKLFAGIPNALRLSDGWWWLPNTSGEQPPAVRVATKVAYVAARPFTGSDLHRALLRHAARGRKTENESGSMPPGEVLAAWADCVDELTVDDEGLLYTLSEPGDETLSELELTVLETIVFSRGGVCSTQDLLGQIRDHTHESSAGIDTLRSLAIADEVAPNVWSLCGAEYDPQIVDLLVRRSEPEC